MGFNSAFKGLMPVASVSVICEKLMPCLIQGDQNLTLGALSSRSALSVLVGVLLKKFGLLLNTSPMSLCSADVLLIACR